MGHKRITYVSYVGPYIGDHDVFQTHNLYEMDKTAAAAAVNAVTVNLPTSWREQPELWFAQAEGQFRLRGIIDENTKFDHVITLLNAITAANVSDLMRNGKMKKNKKLDRRPKNPGTRCSVGHRGCSPPPVA